MSTLFDKLYKVSQEVKDALKKPGVEKKVKRAFEATVDSFGDQLIDLQERADDLREKVANGNVDRVADLIEALAEIEDVKRLVVIANGEADAFFAEVKE